MKVTWIIWTMVMLWILNYAVAAIASAVILLKKRDVFTLVLTPTETTILNVIATVYGAWLVINIGTAAQTWRSYRPSVTIVFLIQMYISLSAELVFLTAVFNNRDTWTAEFLNHTVSTLVRQYVFSKDAQYILDYTQEAFDCCGMTQWHYEWWMDDGGGVLSDLNSSFAWVPQSCCVRTAYYDGCGVARPRMKVVESSSEGEEEDEYGMDDEEEVLSQTGSFAATDWYSRLNNDPCPDMITNYIGEWPTYVLMALLALSVGKATISTAASLAVFSKKK